MNDNGVRVAHPQVHELAEGPFWDEMRARLLWVDIRRGRVYSADLTAEGLLEIRDEVGLEETVGAVTVSPSGAWLIAGAERLHVRDEAGMLHPGPRLITSGGSRRLNDGKPDPFGRYLVGSLSLAGPSNREELFRVDHDGSIEVLDDDLTLSNGLAWSADGSRLYSVDTERQVVFVRSYDLASGDVGPRSVHLAFDEGYPDGMCMDAEEHLWIAMWGLGRVDRYSPSGERVGSIEIPAPHTSSVAFAGPDLDVLVITTATQDLDDTQLGRFPNSGCVFTARPGVRGLPQPLWAGFSAPTPSEVS
jgi:sugar lactone lactonase YvrE